MDKKEIEEGLEEIAKLANNDGVFIELAVYGGSAIALKWEFRKATRDVDIIVSGDATYIRNAAKKVAEKKGWPTDWMNDAVKGFASPNGDHELYKEYMHDNGGVKVFTPSARYLLAMKCMAMRIDEPDGHNDIDDIMVLIKDVGIKNESELFQLVEAYYPPQKITPKISFGIQEIMNEINSDIVQNDAHGEDWPAREKVQKNLETKEPTPPDATPDTGTMKAAKPRPRKP